MERVTSKQFIGNAIWKFMEIVAGKGVSLAVSLLLARLLMPEHYGIIALTTVFIAFAEIFIQSGFNIALIRKSEVTKEDYSTVMYLSLLFATFLYLVLFTVAPFIAVFYELPELKSIIRVITVLFFFEAVTVVERAMATRTMQFKLMSISAVISSVISGGIGVGMAYFGLGVWALVAQQVLFYLSDMMFMTIFLKWKFSFIFSKSIAKEQMKFSMGVLGSSFLDFAGNNISSLIVGKAFSTEALGYYKKGGALPEQVCLYTYSTVSSVLLPTLASLQTNLEEMKVVVRKIVSITAFMVFPLMGGLFSVASPLVSFLLTDKWLPCVTVLQFSCIYYSCNPLRSISGNVLYAVGKSTLLLRIETFRCSLMLITTVLIIFIFRFDIYALAASNAAIAVIIAVITHMGAQKYINYKLGELIMDIFPAGILTVIMMLSVYLAGSLPISGVQLLFAEVFIGFFVYTVSSILFRVKSLYEIVRLVVSLLKKK